MRRLARLRLQRFEDDLILPQGVRPIAVFRDVEPGRDEIVVEMISYDLPSAQSPWVALVRSLDTFEAPGGEQLYRIGSGPATTGVAWLAGTTRLPELLPIQQVHEIARMCHEANRTWCEINGDASQLSWGRAEGWQTQSAIAGVMFRLENPSAPTSATHEAWMADKAAQGWRRGDVKDPSAKTHPCMVPFGDLPAEQRMKDVLFGALVRSMAEQYSADARRAARAVIP